MTAQRSVLFRVLLSCSLALLTASVSAGIITTEQVVVAAEAEAARPVRETLVKELEARGVAPDEARVRAHVLSDAEVLAMAGNVDSLPAGGALNNTELLLLIIIILLIAL